MQPELSWNVAGIPPEAREAARAAARREGLSVGEWLTRNILKGLAEATDAGSFSRPGPSDFAAPAEPASSPAVPLTREVLDRIARTESDAAAAFRKIDEQLHGLARRVDASERTQTENSKTVTLAATEISTASRDQAEAFEQLGQHVAGLGDRLSRLERHTAADGVRDAVKVLHSGLSRLADQIAENANQSAGQFAAVTRNAELLTSELNDARAETNTVQQRLSSRIYGFEERAVAVENAAQAASEKADRATAETARLNDAQAETNNAHRTLTSRMQSVEERVRATESTAKLTADKLDKTVADLEATRGAQRVEQSESQRQAQLITQLSDALDKLDKSVADLEATRGAQRVEQSESQRQAQLITQLSDALDKLSSRLTAGEAQAAGAVARLENQIGTIEARRADAPLLRRLLGVEHSLAEFSGRLDDTERTAFGIGQAIEENFRTLAARLDAAEERQRDAIAGLAEKTEQNPGSSAPAPIAVASPATAGSESQAFRGHKTFSEPALSLPTGCSTPAPLLAPDTSDTTLALDTPLELDTPLPPEPPENEEPTPLDEAAASSAAREASLAAPEAEESTLRVGLGQFPWSPSQDTIARREKKSVPIGFVLVAGIIVIAAGAVAAGVLLSRGLVGPASIYEIQPRSQSSSAAKKAGPAGPAMRAHTNAASPDTQSDTSDEMTIPGSPVTNLPSRANASSAQNPDALAPPSRRQSARPAASDTAKVAALAAHIATLADSGNPKAELLLGLRYLDGIETPMNEAEAAKWLERAAGKGEAIAAYRVGTLFERGHGVPADASKAMHWYALAARLGNRKAMHNLAVAYAEGSGTPKDLTQAAQWFSKAAALGLRDSEFNLAVLYERGMGVQQSLIDAYKWYAIAAAQGDAESKARLEVISTQLSADERAAAQKAASEFRPPPLDRDANVPPDPSSVG
jgi:localization factor PodJL